MSQEFVGKTMGRRGFVKGVAATGLMVGGAAFVAKGASAQDAATPVATPITAEPTATTAAGASVPVTSLPNTGSNGFGDTTGAVAKTLAVAGAAVAAVAGLIRHKSKAAESAQ